MIATFDTTEIVHLLNLKVPRGRKPQYRLQRFLLNEADWATSNKASLHIGEQGELGRLRQLLGEIRIGQYERLFEEYSSRSRDAGKAFVFPTKKSYRDFVRDVNQAWGKKIELNSLQ